MLLALPEDFQWEEERPQTGCSLTWTSVLLAVLDVPLFPSRGEQLEEEEKFKVKNTICNVGVIICK